MDEVGGGVLLSALLHLFQLLLALTPLGVSGLMWIGVTQLIYILPAIGLALAVGRRKLAQGLAIGAAITFLLSAACWGLMLGIWR